MASVALLLLLALLVAACGGCEFNCPSNNEGRVGQRSVLDCVIQTEEQQNLWMVLWKKDGKTLARYEWSRESPILEVEKGYVFTEPRWSREKINVSLIIENTAEAHVGQYTVHVEGEFCSGDKSVSFHVTDELSTNDQVTAHSDDTGPEMASADAHVGVSPLVKNVAAPLVVIGSLIVGLLLVLVYNKRRSANKCQHEPVNTEEGLELSTLDPDQLA